MTINFGLFIVTIESGTLRHQVRKKYLSYGKIHAIKLYHDKTGQGVMESKKKVEEWCSDLAVVGTIYDKEEEKAK